VFTEHAYKISLLYIDMPDVFDDAFIFRHAVIIAAAIG